MRKSTVILKDGGGGGELQRKAILYTRPDNIEGMINLENHCATSKGINESGKAHQKMLKPFGEILLGVGDVQGPKVSPFRLQEWKCVSYLQGLSVTTFNQVITHNITNRGQPAPMCLPMWNMPRNKASPMIFFYKKMFNLNLMKAWSQFSVYRKGRGQRSRLKTP